MDLYRKFMAELQSWERQGTKEPLLITGARQVGKTWLIDHFCRENYQDYVYLNFEQEPLLASVFDGTMNPEEILKRISILKNKKMTPETAIFMDEIQKSEQAITSLKYFCEAEENYRVIAAGSLLGVKLNRFESSFPVGKVQIQRMYPMDFEEFLIAAGEDALAEVIRDAFLKVKPLPEVIHQKAIQLYHDYLFVGGMPQCVADYIANNCDVTRFNRQLQNYILLAYGADMTKYTISVAEGAKIAAIYDSVPRQLAKENPKFKYKDIRANANKRDFYLPLDWLVSSGMVYKVTKAEVPKTPLKVYAEEGFFKLYLSDVGLLMYASGMSYNDLLNTSDNTFKGAVAENYVVQMAAAGEKGLFYYKPDDSMEIDLLLEYDGEIVPMEIKAGRHKRSTSLKNYRTKFSPVKMIRISENNFGQADELISVPLYAAFCLGTALPSDFQ
ncbi:MAG: ATP-binding protein [Aeriscardovia sp.]|nr:ATP-binding protein [Aeriscardovia sp.]MBR3359822.1 ATP-binding protein [Lachnospiraceae bacterium]